MKPWCLSKVTIAAWLVSVIVLRLALRTPGNTNIKNDFQTEKDRKAQQKDKHFGCLACFWTKLPKCFPTGVQNGAEFGQTATFYLTSHVNTICEILFIDPFHNAQCIHKHICHFGSQSIQKGNGQCALFGRAFHIVQHVQHVQGWCILYDQVHNFIRMSSLLFNGKNVFLKKLNVSFYF